MSVNMIPKHTHFIYRISYIKYNYKNTRSEHCLLPVMHAEFAENKTSPIMQAMQQTERLSRKL